MKTGFPNWIKQLIKDGYFTEKQFIEKVAFYGNKCWICKWRKASAIDHVIPQTYKAINQLSNLRPVCKVCNSAKNNSYPFDLEMLRARFCNPNLSAEQRLINMAKITLNNLAETRLVSVKGKRVRQLVKRGEIIVDDSRALAKAVIGYFESH